MKELLIGILLLLTGDVIIIGSLRRVLRYIAFGKLRRAEFKARHKELKHKGNLIEIANMSYLISRVKEKKRKLFRRYRMIYMFYLLFCISILIGYIIVAFFDVNLSLFYAVFASVPNTAIIIWLRSAVYKNGLNAFPTIRH